MSKAGSPTTPEALRSLRLARHRRRHGHDPDAIERALLAAKAVTDKPT
jgi:transketolase